MSDELRDVLREAKGLVVKDWWQDDGFSPRSGHCVMTAVGLAAPYHHSEHPNGGQVFLAVRALLRDLLGGPEVSVAGWNDAPERTHADAVDLFDRALAAVEAERESIHGVGRAPDDGPGVPGGNRRKVLEKPAASSAVMTRPPLPAQGSRGGRLMKGA